MTDYFTEKESGLTARSGIHEKRNRISVSFLLVLVRRHKGRPDVSFTTSIPKTVRCEEGMFLLRSAYLGIFGSFFVHCQDKTDIVSRWARDVTKYMVSANHLIAKLHVLSCGNHSNTRAKK